MGNGVSQLQVWWMKQKGTFSLEDIDQFLPAKSFIKPPNSPCITVFLPSQLGVPPAQGEGEEGGSNVGASPATPRPPPLPRSPPKDPDRRQENPRSARKRTSPTSRPQKAPAQVKCLRPASLHVPPPPPTPHVRSLSRAKKKCGGASPPTRSAWPPLQFRPPPPLLSFGGEASSYNTRNPPPFGAEHAPLALSPIVAFAATTRQSARPPAPRIDDSGSTLLPSPAPPHIQVHNKITGM